jgi:hypothetical protein
MSALDDKSFEDIAEKFEDMLWRGNRNFDAVGHDFQGPNIGGLGLADANTDHMMYRRGDQYPPFDIWVLYGDVTNAAANHTIKRIIKAEIVGQGQAIYVGGEPIKEQYRFIARNLA